MLDDYWTGTFLSDGVINFWALSFLFDPALSALQGDSVTLATLNFTAMGTGTSALAFEPYAITGIDVKGVNGAKLDLLVTDGSVTVIDGTPAVPEPGTILLFGGGLAGLAFWRRIRKA
ncbi:MAG: PEP-CTERM sorting domain-containing protein [Desulfuromonadaceae bacterium]|nr:PEP-CTERM sorting domain-containing protein [Desulfuromonadaceae bacterium]